MVLCAERLSVSDPIDQLLTVAEIGAAFAGFTAIAGAIIRDSTVRTRSQLYFWIMIEFSFALIFFSLLPVVLFNIELAENVVWISSSAVMAAFIPCHLFGVGAKYIMPAIQKGEFTTRGPWIFVPLFLIVFSVQSANVVGVGIGHTFGAYFLGLAAFVLLVFSNFISLLIQVWTPESGA